MNIKQLLEQQGITPFRAGTSHGGEWHSSCPGCGGGEGRKAADGPSDRFQIWPERTDGGMVYCCRKCGAHGDTIQFLIDFDHKTFPQACALLGIDKGGKKVAPSRAPSTPKPPAAPAVPTFTPATPDLPAAAWMAKATEFAEWAHQQLLLCPEAAAMLAWRGLTMETAIRYRIGFNPGENGKDLHRSRKAWGLPEIKRENGRAKSLWLPRGLVMPVFAADGQVIHLRIRRRPVDVAAFATSITYQVVDGGCHATLVLEPEAKAHAVTESGLDAYLCAQEGRGLVGAVTTWNSTAKPDAAACAVLDQDLRILAAQDNDTPGAKAALWWLQRWPNTAKRWPVPVGKDPGEAIAAGCNLRAWLLAGLPPVLTIGDHADLACDSQGGAAENTGVAGEKGAVDDNQAVEQVGCKTGESSRSNQGNEPEGGEKIAPPAVVVAVASSDSVKELRDLLRQTGIVIVQSENGANREIVPGKLDASFELRGRVSALVFNDTQVDAYLNGLPDGRIAVNG